MDQRDKRNRDSDVAAEEEGQRSDAGSPEAAEQPSAGSEVHAAEAQQDADAPHVVEPELVEPEVVETSPEAQEIAQLNEQLSAAQARLRAVSKAYTDLQAENKAFRERVEAQAKVAQERRAFDLAKTFFDPVMNLKRSILNHGDDLERLVDGLKMVHHQFMVAMEKLGMEEVPGVGADFDPNVHEALAVTPVADASQDGKVLVVHNDGYTVKGKVLQAAQVVIGKYQEPAGEA